MNILILYGENDLYFNEKGFRNLANKLRKAGNVVDDIMLKKTGHMLLFDNKEKAAKRMILKLLQNKYAFKN